VSKTTVNLLTKNEVVEIIRCLGYQAIPKDDDDYGELIFCSYEGVRWNVYLGLFGPLFQEITINLFSWTGNDPTQVLNKWNSENFITASAPCDDSTGQPKPESDGTFAVIFETRINFEGGVSLQHIQSRITEWTYTVQHITKLDGFTFQSPATVIKK